jgi:hypothetical protein
MRGNYYLLRKPSKEYVLSELKRKELILEFSDDKSSSPDNIGTYINFYYESIWKRRYGMRRIKYENQNVNGTETISPLFAPTPIRLSTGGLKYPTSAIRCYTVNGEPGPSPDTKLRILFSNRVDRNLTIGWNIVGGSSTNFINPGFYETATHYDDPLEPSVDLNYAISNQYFYYPAGREYTENNLFSTFWNKTIIDIDKQKLMEMRFYMSEEAISTLKMNSIFFLEINDVQNYFIINKIKEYNIETGEAILELITYDLEVGITRAERVDDFNIWSGYVGSELPTKDPRGRGLDYFDGTIRPDRGIEFGDRNNLDGIGNISTGVRNTVSGDGNIVKGDDNFIEGKWNDLSGVGNYIDGNSNEVRGNENEVYGDNVDIKGDGNLNTGSNNEIRGNENIVDGWNITLKGDNLVGTEWNSQYFNDYKVNPSGVIENPLIIRVNTALSGDSADNQFQLSYDTGGTILVKWGDGSEDFTNGVLTHTYLNPGIYNIEITAVPTVNEYIFTVDRTKIIGIFSIGNLGWTDSIEVFSGCSNIARIVLNDGRFLSNSLRTGEMFAGIISTPNIDVSSFDTSSLTGAVEMFRDGGWETINISGWNTSNLTLMNGMFRDCPNLTEVIGLSSFNIDNVIDMTDIFTGTTLSSTNYEEIWAGWTLSTPQTGVTFSGGGMTLSVGSPGDIVRDDFITNYSWIVIDGDNP